MAMVPLHSPQMPCLAEVNGMFVGKWIYICGRSHQNADRFAINLQCGPDGNDKIALHFNPRFPAEQVVRNTKDGGWGKEERDGGFPFKQGQLFGVKITCRADGYEIRANRYRTFAMYDHRIPFHTVTHVGVAQDCDVILVCSGIEGLDVPAQVIQNPSPRKIDIPFHNIREHCVVIAGKPTTSSGRMAINFTSGDGNRIHFHFNPRMSDCQIVRNTKDGGWGREERDLDMPFPFVEGVPFLAKMTVERRRFKVEINGSFAFYYEKRLKALKDIRVVELMGDVDIEKIIFY